MLDVFSDKGERFIIVVFFFFAIWSIYNKNKRRSNNRGFSFQKSTELGWPIKENKNLQSISVWAFTAWRRELETAEADLSICSFQRSVSLGISARTCEFNNFSQNWQCMKRNISAMNKDQYKRLSTCQLSLCELQQKSKVVNILSHIELHGILNLCKT